MNQPAHTQRSQVPMTLDEDNELEETDLSWPSTSLWQSLKTKLSNAVGDNLGMGLLLGSQLGNTVMITGCKLLVTDKEEGTIQFHPLQILFVRMLITYLCCIAYMAITKSVPYAPWGKPEVRKWLILRGVIGFTGVFGMYFSLLYLSLSDAVAITFLIPLVTAFLAFVLLRERYSLLEACCSVISLGGVLLIAKPSFIFGQDTDKDDANGNDDSVESTSTTKRLIATCVGLLGVLGGSTVYIILRKIGNQAHPLISVGYFAFCTVIVTTTSIIIIPSVSFVLPQTAYQWVLFIAIGVTGFVYQFALTAGVQRVKASKAALVIYTQMVFAIGLDIIIWHHFPGVLSVLGITVIIGCTLVVMMYKPNDDRENYNQVDDLESGPGESSANKYSSEDYELQDFVIGDEEGDEDGGSGAPKSQSVKPENIDVDNELNSVKFSQKIKLNHN